MPVRFVARWISLPALIQRFAAQRASHCCRQRPVFVSANTRWTLTAEGLVMGSTAPDQEEQS